MKIYACGEECTQINFEIHVIIVLTLLESEN